MTATKQPYMPMVAHKLPVDTSTRLKFQGADGECVHVGSIEGSWNARRIAASWNACRNLPVEMLETVGQIVTEGALPHRFLTMQHAELLAALKGLLEVPHTYSDGIMELLVTKEEVEAAKALVSKIENFDLNAAMEAPL